MNQMTMNLQKMKRKIKNNKKRAEIKDRVTTIRVLAGIDRLEQYNRSHGMLEYFINKTFNNY